VRGILFDVDGTLVDTTYLHAVTWWEALSAAGYAPTMSRVHAAIGMGSDKIVEFLVGGDPDPDRDAALAADHTRRYRRYWPSLRPLPGAVDLLRACRELDLAVVLASSASAEELTALRGALNSDDLITAATSSDDADRGKPAPDILAAALTQSGLPADEVLFVGDSVWDIRAAARLRIPCATLTCGGTCAADLRVEGAAAVFTDPADLLTHLRDLVALR
jgi:HAD superfamily hydrolase (TIGR01509 family)